MTELDRLLVRIEADVRPLDEALGRIGTGARAAGDAVAGSLGVASSEGLAGLTRELETTNRAARLTGERMSAALDRGNASALALAESIGGALGQALGGSIDSWEDLRRVALSVLDDILRSLAKAGGGSRSGGGGILGGLIGALGGGSGGFSIPGLSAGGRVEPGGLYEVGEGGRELFVPNLPGSVLPSLASDRLLARGGRGTGGGGVQVHNSYSIDARGAQEGVGAEIVAALDARSARIKAEAVDQVFALMDRGGRYAKASGRR